MEVFLLNRLSKRNPDAYMFPQSCMSIEAGEENLQILNTVSSHGVVDM